jgi:hypothetical protein
MPEATCSDVSAIRDLDQVCLPSTGWAAARISGTSSSPTDSASPEGVQIIHVIPEGIACVLDQVSEDAPVDGQFEAFLSAAYKNDALGRSLAEANGLVPNDVGQVSVYVPSDLPVVIPAMCYFKDGASAVTLQANGMPQESSSSSVTNAAVWLVAITAVIVLLIYGVKKLMS